MNLMSLIIVLYSVILFGAGIFIKNAKNGKEYTVGKQKINVFGIASALVMTHFGAGFILGGAELGYRYGIYGLVYGLAAAIGLFFLGIFSKRIYTQAKKEKISTISMFLFKKYKNKKIEILAAVISIIALIGIASAQFFAAIKIFSVLGMNMEISSAITFIIVILIATKGIDAFAKFSKINIAMAAIGAIAAIIFVYNMKIKPLFNVTFETISPSSLLWILLPTMLYTLIGQDLQQKIYSSDSWKNARNASFISSVIIALLSLFPVIIGMQSKALFQIEAYEALPKFIAFAFPSILKGLFIAAILAAVIGSSQSVINAAATQFSEDLIKNPKKHKRIHAISALVISSLALILALLSGSIVNNIVLACTIYTAAMFMPISVAFFSKNPRKIFKPVFIISILSIILTLIIETGLINTSIPSIIISVLSSFILLTLYLLCKNKLKSVN
jgi:SSS family solute:Na+ symporter